MGITTNSLPCPSAGMGMCPPFSARVEAWRKEVAAKAGSKPIDFLMAWLQVESDGNPCSSTPSYEAGIWQLMPGDNINFAQTTLDLMHPSPPCAAGSTVTAPTSASRDSLTDDQAAEQIRAGMTYIDWCISYVDAHLAQAGMTGQAGWTPKDWSYWALVKQAHAAPAYISTLLSVNPTDFDDAAQQTGLNVSNARRVGIFGAGGGSTIGNLLTGVPTWFAIGLGIAGLFATIFIVRAAKKRYPKVWTKLHLPEKVPVLWN